ncbi:hypothetical protein BCR39DRAFT_585327 [Naematelia encephala]|uniref:Uncharacterized protein n=1 Tax=Naematelia encephala TaxID=71784 RepID=A0A1Y2BNH6_9TREE|nr:hypothetical protein BCR39DRAFT_585327 [Naematelia encephala]
MASRPSLSDQPLLPTANSEQEQESDNSLPTMGVTLSTARIIAPASFLFDFGCQMYGMLSSPNMKEIHDRHPAAFAPQPFAIGGFFGPQQILQLVWMRELFRSDREVENGPVRYAPWYALGNVCIGVWMFFWNSDQMKTANVFVIINTLTQVYYLVTLRDKQPGTYQSRLTNIINITFAGIGILDLFHNTSAAYYTGVAPNTLVKVLTGIATPLSALASPLLFGACIAYDAFAIAVGQHQLAGKASLFGTGGGGGEGWARLMGGLGLGVTAIVGARAWAGARWL